MNRRDFFRRAAIVAAGTVAADQLELLERLAHAKVFTTGLVKPFGSYEQWPLGLIDCVISSSVHRNVVFSLGPFTQPDAESIRSAIQRQTDRTVEALRRRLYDQIEEGHARGQRVFEHLLGNGAVC